MKAQEDERFRVLQDVRDLLAVIVSLIIILARLAQKRNLLPLHLNRQVNLPRLLIKVFHNPLLLGKRRKRN